ncbi:MAG: PEP-utilizing enzyme [Actinomycetota bacterium]
MTDTTFEPPGPGPWQQDEAHVPHGFSPMVEELYPESAVRGFSETFARWGVLLDTLQFGIVNGFLYQQPQPFDVPGPDGPMAPEEIGAEIGRRAGVAADAFESKIWHDVMREWEEDLKPSAVSRHRELAGVDLAGLDDAALTEHLQACFDHLRAMAYQHHRFNASAIIPPADFALHAAAWLGEDPRSMFGVFDGHSPASGVVSPELAPAVDALAADPDAATLLTHGGDPAETLRAVRAAVPEVDEYLQSVGFRLVDGFDVTALTTAECPQIVLGRLVAGLEVDRDEARARSDEFAASLRARVAEENRALFDELLEDARAVYRLRDERGLYSDMSAFGILRWALLEVGSRLRDRGAVTAPDHVFEMQTAEVLGLMAGSESPTAAELEARAEARAERVRQGAPRYLGPPPPEPPPLDELPPPLARVMGAVGFGIDGVLGQMEEAAGDDDRVVGIAVNPGVYEGTVRVIEEFDDLFAFQEGEVLVARTTGEAFNSMIHLIGAIVTDHGSFISHAAIVARECGFPGVVGCIDATERLCTGDQVRVDGAAGEVTRIG